MKQDDDSLSTGQEKSSEPDDDLEWLDVLANAESESVDQPADDQESSDSAGESDQPASIDDTVEIKAPDSGMTKEDETDLETQILEPAPITQEEENDIDATLVDLQIPKAAEDNIPEWLKDSEPELEHEGVEDAGGDDLGWLDKLADAGKVMVSEDDPQADESQSASWDEQNDVPEDPDEAMAWLEQLAAQQGASIDELPSVNEKDSDDDRPMGEDQSIATVESPGDKKTLQEGGEPPNVAEEFDRFAAAVESEIKRIEQDKTRGQDELTSESDRDFDEIPEDPDEAMAWLEKLAARQGAQIEELPTLSLESERDTGEREALFDAEVPSEVAGSEEDEVEDEELDELALPEDDDEALAWLEELADEEPMVMEQDVSMVEEPITPVRPLDVESARQEVEEIFPDSRSERDFELDEDLSGEDEDGLAWMEQLVVERQEIEDAHAIQPTDDESETEEIEPPDWLVDSDDTLAVVDSEIDEESRELMEELAAVKDEEDQASMEITNALLEEELASDELIEEIVTEPAIYTEETPPDDSEDYISSVVAEEEEEALVTSEGDADIELPELTDIEIVEERDQEPEGAPFQSADDMPAVEPRLEIDESPIEIEVEEAYEEAVPSIEVDAQAPEQLAAEVAVTDELDTSAESGEEVDELEWMAESVEIDAEAWLEAEEAKAAAEQPPKIEEGEHFPLDLQEEAEPQDDTIPQEEDVGKPTEDLEEEDVLRQPDRELLEKAREAIASGDNAGAVESFDALVRRGHGIPYLIADLELSIEEYGAQIPLQRVLGDAYAQNGQLSKALITYREALDQL